MSPYAFYQFWINRSDVEVGGLLRVFTFRGREEIGELERLATEAPAGREAQRVLAGDVTTLVHGAAECAKAVAASQALFGQGELADLDERTLAAALAEVPLVTVKPAPSGLRGPPGDRRGRSVPEQPAGAHRGSRAGPVRPAARPVPGRPPGQAHRRRGGGRQRLAPNLTGSTRLPSVSSCPTCTVAAGGRPARGWHGTTGWRHPAH